MRRGLEVVGPLGIDSFDGGSRAITLSVDLQLARGLLFELLLLEYGLSDRLSLRHRGRSVLWVVVSNADAGVGAFDEEPPRCELSSRQIELVVSYLLRYVRDGMAEVRHLDVDLGGRSTLVIRSADSASRP